ncbi:MAG: VOC family protein [Actinobacteria bacterium]|jgi:hypothetical protein|nr:VOC family protein [Actinomycetota bacterium]
MHLDHISYATSHDNIVDVIQRIGSQLGASFIDGGIHPQFGTRNFVLPLKNSRYIEVVCPLDHPASDKYPFGQLVTKKAEAGGGWLSWVVAVDDVSKIESKLDRKAVDGHRKKPDGKDLHWKQIGVLDTLEEASNPFFIQWSSDFHPSSERDSDIDVSSIEIYGDSNLLQAKYGLNGLLSKDEPTFTWLDPALDSGIEAVVFKTSNGDVRID